MNEVDYERTYEQATHIEQLEGTKNKKLMVNWILPDMGYSAPLGRSHDRPQSTMRQ